MKTLRSWWKLAPKIDVYKTSKSWGYLSMSVCLWWVVVVFLNSLWSYSDEINLKIVVCFCRWIAEPWWWSRWASTAAQRRCEKRSRKSQNWWHDSAETASSTSAGLAIIGMATWWRRTGRWTGRRAGQWGRWSSGAWEEAAAQRSEFLCDGWDLGWNDAGDDILEAWKWLRRLNSVLSVFFDVSFVQLINPPCLGVDELINFLQQNSTWNLSFYLHAPGC